MDQGVVWGLPEASLMTHLEGTTFCLFSLPLDASWHMHVMVAILDHEVTLRMLGC